MYPSLDFRKLFDTLSDRLGETAATGVYLRVLQCAKQEGLAVAESIAKKMMAVEATLTKKSALAMLEDIQATAPSSVLDDYVVEMSQERRWLRTLRLAGHKLPCFAGCHAAPANSLCR